MIGIGSGNRMILEIAEAPCEGDMLALADLLLAQEQDLVIEERLADFAEKVVVADRFGEADPGELRADVSRKLLDAHQITKIEEPVVLPASMSLCAWTASSSSYRWLISILIRPLAT